MLISKKFSYVLSACTKDMKLNMGIYRGGATILATNNIGHSKKISATTENHIDHTENPYRPQTISATPYQPQNIW